MVLGGSSNNGKIGGDKKEKKGKNHHSTCHKTNDGIINGGQKQTHIVVNIGKLQDQTVIKVESTEKRLSGLGDKVQEILLRAVNSVNQMQTN